MNIWKCRTVVNLSFALGATMLTWLVLSLESPMADYFLDHVAIKNIVGQLLIIPYLIVLALRLDTLEQDNFASYSLAFLQWLVVGILVSLLLCRRGTRDF
jgi:hypothetical protein